MNPTSTRARGINTHTYPAYDYAVAIGTGLVACKDGVFTDLPGQPTRRLMGNLYNGQAWPNYIAGAQNSGNIATISHGNGEYTCYLHTSPFDVNALRGRRVNQGEVFAQSGHNGWSTGPHLHYEVWKDGVRVDPGAWLANIKQGDDTMVVTEEDNRQIFLAVVGRNPYDSEKGRYLGKRWQDAIKDCLKNQDRVKGIDPMVTAYYKNGSQVPNYDVPNVMINGKEYKPV